MNTGNCFRPKDVLLTKALTFAKARISLTDIKEIVPNAIQRIDQLVENLEMLYS